MTDIAWFAGLFEGEGSVSVTKPRKDRNSKGIALRLTSTDADVLDLISDRVGLGSITGPFDPPSRLGKKKVWHWQLTGVAAVELLREIQPFLGYRRSGKIEEAIAEWENRERRAIRLPKMNGPVYVSGPMTGYDLHNYPAFESISYKLRNFGVDVISPHELSDPSDSTDWDWFLRRDIVELTKCNTIALLPGWLKSRGAKLEHHIGKELGMSVFYPPQLDQWIAREESKS